jgi:putative endonuclease
MDNSLYKGYTDDLKRRVTEEHNKGKGGKYTKHHAPFKIIYYKAYVEEEDAKRSEKFFKTGYGREILKDKLQTYFQKLNKKL